MSTIQKTESTWRRVTNLLEPGTRMLFAAVTPAFFICGLVAAYIAVFAKDLNELIFVASVSFLFGSYCAYVAISDVVLHNRLLRHELTQQYDLVEGLTADVEYFSKRNTTPR